MLAVLNRSVPVHHIVPQRAFDNNLPNGVSPETRDRVELLTDALDRDEIDNLITVPNTAQRDLLEQFDQLDAWNPNPNSRHSGSHPNSYFDEIADRVQRDFPDAESLSPEQAQSIVQSLFNDIRDGNIIVHNE